MKLPSFAIVFTYVVLLAACSYSPRDQGKALYEKHCQGCHMDMGEGLGQLIPPVKNSDWVMNNPEILPCIIRNGMEGPVEVNGQVFDSPMPSNKMLDEVELINLTNYIRQWNNLEPITLPEMKRQMSGCKG